MKPQEYKIKPLLVTEGLDGAIVSSPENFHYLTGFVGHQHAVSRQPGFSFAVMVSDDKHKTCAVTMDFEEPTFLDKTDGSIVIKKYDTWVGIKNWEEIADSKVYEQKAMKSSLDILVEAVEEMGLQNKKIGLELDYLPVSYYNSLLKTFPNASFSNISDLFVTARSVKTPQEIDMFRMLCSTADSAFFEVSKIVKIGVSEKELAQCFRNHVMASGKCAPSSWSMFSAGSNSSKLGLPEEAKIADGDVVKFDAGVNAEFDFYTTDTSRGWIVGNGDPVLLHLKDRLYEAQRRMIESAKPGMPIKELFGLGFQWVKDKYPSYQRGHLGHSISMGPATAEAPYINATETRPLEAGMVLAMEVPCYIRDVNGFNIEDMVLITETGAEVLTPKTPHYL